MEKETEIESLDEGIIDLESARLCQKGMRERERERERERSFEREKRHKRSRERSSREKKNKLR